GRRWLSGTRVCRSTAAGPAWARAGPTKAAPCRNARSAGRTRPACASRSTARAPASCATCAPRSACRWSRSAACASAASPWPRCRLAPGATCRWAGSSDLRSPGRRSAPATGWAGMPDASRVRPPPRMRPAALTGLHRQIAPWGGRAMATARAWLHFRGAIACLPAGLQPQVDALVVDVVRILGRRVVGRLPGLGHQLDDLQGAVLAFDVGQLELERVGLAVLGHVVAAEVVHQHGGVVVEVAVAAV